MPDAPPPPEFGEPLPLTGSPETIAFLARRRSASARMLEAPGPSAEELELILRLAARVPDHGKLTPWRFLTLSGAGKAEFSRALVELARTRSDVDKATAALSKFDPPPAAVVVISRITPGHKIPEWEQVLSAGAVCMNLLTAASAMGFGANWITDWYSVDPEATRLLGLRTGEKVAGFVFLGTAAEAPLERVRPDLSMIAEAWTDRRSLR